jgi:uncharacterized protein with FMN-binding domain
MRRIVTAILSTITALVLLFSYHTSTDSATVAGSPVAQLGASSGSTSQSRSSNSSGSSTPRQSSPAASSATYTGGVADTQWGPVQVQITVQGGKVTRSGAVQYPQNNDRDFMINSYALPILDQEVVQQQTASIDTVSGATVTSDGYLQSLQSAIDQAHL